MGLRVVKHTEKLLGHWRALLRQWDAEVEFPGFNSVRPRLSQFIEALARRNRRAKRSQRRCLPAG